MEEYRHSGLNKVVIWMNIPSHHQLDFFVALEKIEKIDLQIRYFEKLPETRRELGWNDFDNLPKNQKFVNDRSAINALATLDDWKDRIHIVPGFSSFFLKELLDILIDNNIKWIHWSERSGKTLTKLLNYNYFLINLIKPTYFYFKGYKRYAKRINKFALGAFAISKLAKEDFKKWGVEANKIKILNYALAPLSFKNKDSKSDNFTFLYLGALTEHKGIEVLIKSFSKLVMKNSSWHLTLIGKDYSNGYYSKLVKELNLINKVDFLGTINSTEINEYISKANVFVLPTFFDGWGAVLNEAASLAKPLISTYECGAAYHLIKNHENGFIVKAKSVLELKKAMQFYVDNPSEIDGHGKLSYDVFCENTPEINASIFLNNINQLLNE